MGVGGGGEGIKGPEIVFTDSSALTASNISQEVLCMKSCILSYSLGVDLSHVLITTF